MENNTNNPPGGTWQDRVTLMTNMYEARMEDGGESWQALGVTTIVDGRLRQFFDIVKQEMREYPEDIDVFRAIFFAGLEEMRKQVDARRIEKNL